MLKASQQIETFSESQYQDSLKPGNVDRANGMIRNVKIVGTVSRRGRVYPIEVLREGRQLYEGASVNIDHPPEKNGVPLTNSRPFVTRFGQIVNVREGSDGLYGDLAFLKSHALAESVCEAAERFPNKFGLSPIHDCVTEIRGGKLWVRKVVSVRSVDVVGDPATNKGLFESADPQGAPSSRSGSARGGEPAASAPPASAAGRAEIKAGILASMQKVAADESLSAAERAKKLRELLDTLEKSLAIIDGIGDASAMEGMLATQAASEGRTLIESVGGRDLLAAVDALPDARTSRRRGVADFLRGQSQNLPGGEASYSESMQGVLAEAQERGRAAVASEAPPKFNSIEERRRWLSTR